MLDALILAAAPLLATAFTLWGSPATWLEVIAFGLSLWMVACNLRVNPLGWPLAMASSVLYALLFAHSKLYGEALLQLFFVIVAAWGWQQWLRGTSQDGTRLAVHRLPARQRWQIAAATLAAWPMVGLLLRFGSDSDVPFLDALPTVGSVAGQLLLGRKLIENWLVWLAVNIVSIGVFAYKALWLTVLLYAIFAVLSWAGWRAWKLQLADERT